MDDIKFLTKKAKYDILSVMKIFYSLILLFLISALPACAVDDVYVKGKLTSGKIFAYSDGLIQIKSGGVDYSFVREKKNDYFGDSITYRERPIRGGVVTANCRIIYVDRYYVIFKTEFAQLQVPRYRVSSIVINAD